MTVAELLARMSGAELAAWMAYEEQEGPLGPSRSDWQTALIATTVANTVPRRKGKARTKITDMLIKWKSSRAPRQDAAELEAIGRDLARRLGGEWTEAPREGVTDEHN